MEPIVGLLTVELYVSDAMTLKDKRSVISSLIDRVAQRFNVAVAEIDGLDRRRVAVIAVSTVANDARHVTRVLDSVLNYIQAEPRAIVQTHQIEYW